MINKISNSIIGYTIIGYIIINRIPLLIIQIILTLLADIYILTLLADYTIIHIFPQYICVSVISGCIQYKINISSSFKIQRVLFLYFHVRIP